MLFGLNLKYQLITLVRAHNMKYFENLPKRTFESSIGNFEISDFFTYLDSSNVIIDKSNVEIDSKTTLLEASYSVYNDPNSFWLFLTANNTVNPFTLLATNANIFITENENKINMNIVSSPAGSTALAFPEGSIVVPYIANTGGCASYSSVGNFSLDGPLTLIEDTSFYQRQMIIKDQKGGTFIAANGLTGSGIVVITPIEGGTYSIQKLLYPTNTKKAIDTTVKVELTTEGFIEEYSYSDKYKPSKGKSSPPASLDFSGPTGTSEVTALQTIELSSKNISAYVQSQVGLLKSSFVTAKYS